MTSPRPICVHCGKPYGQRHTSTETVQWVDGERPPRYSGNGIVVKEVGDGYVTATRALLETHAMRLANPTRRAQALADAAKVPAEKMRHDHRIIWDGVSWRGGYVPFCTLRCALDYARKAYARKKGAA